MGIWKHRSLYHPPVTLRGSHMRIGSFIRSMVSRRALGDETVRTQEILFAQSQAEMPDMDPHFHLARVLESRWRNRRRWSQGPIPTSITIEDAMRETMLVACVAADASARALGLLILKEEHPDIVSEYPEFDAEFERLMAPVRAALEDGSLEELYRKTNPQMASVVDLFPRAAATPSSTEARAPAEDRFAAQPSSGGDVEAQPSARVVQLRCPTCKRIYSKAPEEPVEIVTCQCGTRLRLRAP